MGGFKSCMHLAIFMIQVVRPLKYIDWNHLKVLRVNTFYLRHCRVLFFFEAFGVLWIFNYYSLVVE